MPTKEPIVNTIVPKEAPKPIPERVAVTRAGPKPQNGHQPITDKSVAAADSATPEESVKLSPQLSALARKEQAFRQREQQLKQREKDLESKLAKADQFDQLQTKFGAKDFSEAEKLGLSYEEYTKWLLDKQQGEDPQAKAFSELKAEIAALKKSQEESVSQSFDETVSAYRKELASAVESKPEFSKVKKFEDEDAQGKKFTGLDVALQLILDAWEEDGEEMTVDQALADTEIFIRERAQKMAALIAEPKESAVEERKLPPPSRTRTLTNDLQPTGVEKKPQISLQNLSEAERYAEARRRALAKRQQG